MTIEETVIRRHEWEQMEPTPCPWCSHPLSIASKTPEGFQIGPCLWCTNPITAESNTAPIRRATEADLNRLTPSDRARLNRAVAEARAICAERKRGQP
jgi:hypothetical protein